MTLNEILLIIAVAVLLVVPSLLIKRERQPLNTYIQLVCGVLLMILVWGFAGEGSLPLIIMVTSIVIKNAFKTWKEYKEFSRRAEIETH